MATPDPNEINLLCFHAAGDHDGFPCNASASAAAGLGVICGAGGLIFVMALIAMVHRAPRGSTEMNAISDKIHSGAKTFLQTEYRYLVVFGILCCIALFAIYFADPPSGQKTDGLRYAAGFAVGAALSAMAGWGGMTIATDANVRVTQAAKEGGLPSALKVAFQGGAVTGFQVVGLGLTGLSIFYWILVETYTGLSPSTDNAGEDSNTLLVLELERAAEALAGFGFGASSIALFARVAGGTFTKAADVGADLVGKLEMDIPEDDVRNPAVVADLVGDNVGDVAGMGADLFESFVGSIIAAITLAKGDIGLSILPIWVSGGGIVASWVGFQFVGTKDDATQKDLMLSLHKGTMVSSVLVAIFSAIIIFFVFEGRYTDGIQVWVCIVVGLAAGVVIGMATEYFTSYSFWPVRSIAQAGVTGPASVIIQGLGIGKLSTVLPTIIIVGTILTCQGVVGEFGIAMAAVGMLSTLGITLATDAMGPIADNAGGIAEMAHLDQRVRSITDTLDALGNTTAATGKGFAIGSAVLTSLSLLSAFADKAGLKEDGVKVDIIEPVVLSGVLIGAVLPFFFAALTMLSVQKSAGMIIQEVRRQFAEIQGLKEGTAEAESDRCVAICTTSAVHEMILPGMYAVLTPVTVGFLIGPRSLAGLLGGAIASGMMLAVMMANTGGAWDNSKKFVEIEGAHGGKGTDVHKACVVGDTVGDPFKDTSGPALNILIKLMSVVSLTIAPLIRNGDTWDLWFYGMIPLGILAFGTYAIYQLFWKRDIFIASRAGRKPETSKLISDEGSRQEGEVI